MIHAQPMPAPALPFDPLRGLAATGDDAALLRFVASKLVASMPQRLADLRSALERGDLPAVQRLAHQTKGSALTVGAIALGERCSALDQAARRNDLDEARKLAIDLDAMSQAFADGLAAWDR
jgi:HPt (histidine-containing phosphotransfer) domain-containing protein